MLGRMSRPACFESRHAGNDLLEPHRHNGAYAALVLDGEHMETGCEGRRSCPPGSLLVHPVFHLHGNRFSAHGARVLNLALPPIGTVATRAWHVDLHAAEDCLRSGDVAGLSRLLETATPLPRGDDGAWPAQLLAMLRADPTTGISAAARHLGVSAAHASRTIARRYGMPPQALRLELRLRAALALLAGELPLVDVAQQAGFADQAHFGRTVRRLCGAPPSRLRTWIKSVQDDGVAPALE